MRIEWPGLYHRAACSLGYHRPAIAERQWHNSPSGNGFDVTTCRQCGTEMTRRSGGPWRAVPMAERR